VATTPSGDRLPPRGRAALPVLFAYSIAMAYVEAMVVVYLRRLFPLDEWSRASSYADVCRFIEQSGVGWSEQTREFATIVMLASVAFLFGRNRRERAAAFLIAFGLWDVFYYVFLSVWVRWPASLLDRDILFLIPCPWVSPVIVPVCISAGMVAAGLWMLRAPGARAGGGPAASRGPAR
jgi:hypothetical protein